MSKKTKSPKRSATPAAVLPAPRRLYAIGLGDSYEAGVGAVIRVEATSEEEALRRAREAADLFLDGTTLLGSDDCDVPGLDSIRIYFDGTKISAENVEDVEDLD